MLSFPKSVACKAMCGNVAIYIFTVFIETGLDINIKITVFVTEEYSLYYIR